MGENVAVNQVTKWVQASKAANLITWNCGEHRLQTTSLKAKKPPQQKSHLSADYGYASLNYDNTRRDD
jgi:hypothetical protein